MTRNEITRRFPGASESFIAANLSVGGEAPTAVVERNAGLNPLGTPQVKESRPRRFLVRITSLRRRLLDEDNLCPKLHVDCCRYAGLLPSDAPGTTHIEVGQLKVKTKAEEATVIEIKEL